MKTQAEEISTLRKELAEAKRTAQFNFDQYQDCGKQLHDACLENEELKSELRLLKNG